MRISAMKLVCRMVLVLLLVAGCVVPCMGELKQSGEGAAVTPKEIPIEPVQPGGYQFYPVTDLIQLGGSLNDKLISTEGVVDSIVKPVSGEAPFYWLKGVNGGIIRVQCETTPTINERVKSRGVFKVLPLNESGSVDEDRHFLGGYIVENHRISDDINPRSSEAEKKPAVVIKQESVLSMYMPYLIAGAAFLVVLLLILAIYANSVSRRAALPIHPLAMPPVQPSAQSRSTVPTGTVDDDEKTRIEVRSSGVSGLDGLDEKTIKYLPGYLEVVAGGRVGDRIPLCGGNAVTIGRIHKEGKGPAFIGLEDLANTKALGRSQVVIRYNDANKKFTIEHKGTNSSILDGKEMAAGEACVLGDNTEIRLPSGYAFRFRLGTPAKL